VEAIGSIWKKLEEIGSSWKHLEETAKSGPAAESGRWQGFRAGANGLYVVKGAVHYRGSQDEQLQSKMRTDERKSFRPDPDSDASDGGSSPRGRCRA
jgi:hypothetical protein